MDPATKVGPVDESLKLLRLRTGALMPSLGMGTWHHGPREEIQDAVRLDHFSHYSGLRPKQTLY